MFITNVGDVVDKLRPRLRDYLTLQLGSEATKRKFKCYVHKDQTPSMYYNPKNGEETVHCFSCGTSHDIFAACAFLEGLPQTGPEWITQTLPHLAQKLNVQIMLGTPSETDTEKARHYKLTSDITTLLAAQEQDSKYIQARKWSTEFLTNGSISMEDLKNGLVSLGWTLPELLESRVLETSKFQFFGEDKLTFVIRDYRKRPIGFMTRNIEYKKTGAPKWINSSETPIYEKGKTLFGLDVALVEARKNGLYVVEGVGEVASFHRVGIKNVAALCGTAFTADHLALLKMLGIHTLFFALDWDEAGTTALGRIFKHELRFAPGATCYVVEPPVASDPPGSEYKDPDEFLFRSEDAQEFLALKKTPAFEWVLRSLSKTDTPENICQDMIPIVASEVSAIRREMLIRVLSDQTNISTHSIQHEVDMLRDGKMAQRAQRIEGAAQLYLREVRADALNAQAYLSQHEQELQTIEKEYQKDSIGSAYQLSRFDAMQERKESAEANKTEFIFGAYKNFETAIAGGMDNTSGVLTYVGGDPNGGKTTLVLALGLDVAMSDPDAITLIHCTDDSYTQLEPRMITNVAQFIRKPGEPKLTIGMAANPKRNIITAQQWDVYSQAKQTLRTLISDEKLIIIDMEDGPTLSVLETQLRYVRKKFKNQKLLVVADNTHNYMDFDSLEQTMRMRKISNIQKGLTGKYQCAMIATAEYRKRPPAMDQSKISYATDDDLADARALKYRPNMIIHVYNDLNTRPNDAHIYWQRQGLDVKEPRLLLLFTKNKISSFKSPKDTLVMDLDPDNVCVSPCDARIAAAEARKILAALQNKKDHEEENDNEQTYTMEQDE